MSTVLKKSHRFYKTILIVSKTAMDLLKRSMSFLKDLMDFLTNSYIHIKY